MQGTGNLHILQIGPKSPKWTVSIQHGRNIGPTWEQGPNFGPTWTNWLPLRPNLAPRWRDLAAWAHLGATLSQVEVHTASKRGPFSLVFSTFFAINPYVVSPLAPTWCEAVAKGAKLRHVRTDLDFHAHHMASIWNPSVLLRAQLQPNMANFRQLYATWAQVGPSWGPLG